MFLKPVACEAISRGVAVHRVVYVCAVLDKLVAKQTIADLISRLRTLIAVIDIDTKLVHVITIFTPQL